MWQYNLKETANRLVIFVGRARTRRLPLRIEHEEVMVVVRSDGLGNSRGEERPRTSHHICMLVAGRFSHR
jgi:hypothetical protein